MKESTSSFPEHSLKVNERAVTELIAKAEAECKPYNGDWEAPWLLSKTLLTPTWEIDEPRKKSVHGENSRPANKIKWDILLHNGSKLTEPANAVMFEAVAKSSFLFKNRPNSAVSNLTLVRYQYSLLVFTRWLYVNDGKYQPSTHAFTRIDTQGILDFLSLAGEGGTPWILGYPHTLIKTWYETATNSTLKPNLIGDLVAVPDEVRTPIIGWLTANNYYREPNKFGEIYLDRRMIAKAMGWDVNLIKMHAKFGAFLRQFEPQVTSHLLSGREYRREYPSHKTPTLQEAIQTTNSSSSLLHWQTISILLSQRIHLTQFIPDTTNIHQGELYRFACSRSKQGNHTRWIPLKLALFLTNEALRWVLRYGDDIIDLYLQTASDLLQGNFLGGPHGRMWKLEEKRHAFANSIGRQESLSHFDIDGWQSKLAKNLDYAEFRRAPGLNDILAILVGAITLLLSFLKPIRQTEVQDLRRNAALFKEGDGYWVQQSLAKAGQGGHRPTIERPIPRVAAKALMQIDRLSEGLRSLKGISTGNSFNLLFFLPNRDVADDFDLHPMTPTRMNGYIDRFVDYLDIPTDEHGRRWYPRVHETRKCFLITFFWCFRYSSLEASRWMAGHSNASDVYQYIEANFPGQELPQIEAEYCAEQLWLYDAGDKTEASNVSLIYKSVCAHFHVSEISLIEESELNDWLELAFQEKKYRIEPITIRSADGSVDTDICFRVIPETKNA